MTTRLVRRSSEKKMETTILLRTTMKWRLPCWKKWYVRVVCSGVVMQHVRVKCIVCMKKYDRGVCDLQVCTCVWALLLWLWAELCIFLSIMCDVCVCTYCVCVVVITCVVCVMCCHTQVEKLARIVKHVLPGASDMALDANIDKTTANWLSQSYTTGMYVMYMCVYVCACVCVC